MKLVIVLPLLMLLTSCSSYKIVNVKPQPDILVTKNLKEFLAREKSPKVVLRVNNALKIDNSYYEMIERELMRAGFIVKDRALYTDVFSRSGVDYKEIGANTNTDLIIEVSQYDPKVPYVNKQGINSKGKTSDIPSIETKGAVMEFKVVMLSTNEIGGNFTYKYVPCTDGCDIVRFGGQYVVKDENKCQMTKDEERKFVQESISSLVEAFKK